MAEEAARAEARRAARLAALEAEPEREPELERPEVSAAIGSDALQATPLMMAAHGGQSSTVRRLLELGADHTAVGTAGLFEGKTALECAVRYSNEEAAALLREWAGVQTFPCAMRETESGDKSFGEIYRVLAPSVVRTVSHVGDAA